VFDVLAGLEHFAWHP